MTIRKIYLSEDLPTKQSDLSVKQKESDKRVMDYDFLNTDVLVQLEGGDLYRANFITLQKLIDEMQAHEVEAIHQGRKYYWSKNMVIVKDMRKKDLFPIIEYMIEEGDFQVIFEKLTK